jgi:hypothetical protein
VSVGLGFHAQMTLDEAKAFCSQRESHLTAKADALTQRAARLKARIKLVMGALAATPGLLPPVFALLGHRSRMCTNTRVETEALTPATRLMSVRRCHR